MYYFYEIVPEIVRFGGLNGTLRPGNLSEKVGGFPVGRGPLDPQNQRFQNRVVKNKKLRTSGWPQQGHPMLRNSASGPEIGLPARKARLSAPETILRNIGYL